MGKFARIRVQNTHNHDSLFSETGGTLRVIAPVLSDPKRYNLSGEVEWWPSRAQGQSPRTGNNQPLRLCATSGERVL